MAASRSERPSAVEIAAVKFLLEPWRLLTSPRFFGLENLPRRRPFLLVANHTLMGVLDVPLMVLEIFEKRGLFIRPLGDHMHFQIPLWRDLLARFGTVDGTRDNCRALMRAGESILVFPGGGREVFKHKGEAYKLIWKERVGFVRLAIEFGYPIVPVAAVGAEECYEILVDADEILATPLGPLLKRLTPRYDEIPPLVRGIGPLPRPQRFYFSFGKPISTTRYRGRENDGELCLAVRRKVETALMSQISELQELRRQDPRRRLRTRVRQALGRTLGTE